MFAATTVYVTVSPGPTGSSVARSTVFSSANACTSVGGGPHPFPGKHSGSSTLDTVLRRTPSAGEPTVTVYTSITESPTASGPDHPSDPDCDPLGPVNVPTPAGSVTAVPNSASSSTPDRSSVTTAGSAAVNAYPPVLVTLTR